MQEFGNGRVAKILRSKGVKMTPQEEQFLQAAKQGNKAYVEGQLNNVSSDMKIAAFVYTPSIEISTYLLQYKVEINSYVYNPDKQVKVTALYKACEENYVEKVEWLIKTGADVNLPILVIKEGIEQNGESAFMCVAKQQNFTLMDVLLKAGADTDYKDAQDKTVQDMAPYTKKWLQNYKQRNINEDFLHAAQKGDKSFVQDHMAEVDAVTRIKAFVHTPSLEMAKLLKDNGVDVNGIDKGYTSYAVGYFEGKYSALSVACKNNDTHKALWLIEQGADVNIVYYEYELVANMADINNENRLSPLMWAVENQNIELVEVLIQKGSKINFKGHMGDTRSEPLKTALDLARDKENPELISLLKSVGAKTVEELKQSFASQDAEQIETQGTTIKPSVSVSHTTSPSNTPEERDKKQLQYELVRLCRWGSIKEVDALLSAGADVNGHSLGETPLQNAVLSDNPQMVEFLLNHGAIVTSYVLELAENHHNEEIINLLKSAGAKE